MAFHLKEYQGDPLFTGSALKIIVPMNQDLTGAGSPKIYYRKPDGTQTSVTATIETPATDGKLSYQLTTEHDQPGEWRFWGGAVLSGDSVETLSGAEIVEFFDPGEA